MNSIEAAQAVRDGRCEYATSPIAVGRLTRGKGNLIDLILADDWQLVGEKPQVEEVVRWILIASDGLINGVYSSEESAKSDNKSYYGEKNQVVKLTGHCTRPVPRKVKRREEVKWEYDQSAGGWVFVLPDGRYVPAGANAKYFAEWEEVEP